MSKTKELEEKLNECQKLKEEYLAGWQRARADFLNYKKEEKARIGTNLFFIKGGWLLKLLEIYDALERAKEHLPEDLKDIEWVKGVLQIENQFESFLKEQDLARVNPVGENFDPELHQAVEQVEVKGKEPGKIAEVLEKGYLLSGQLLRPAKVKVVK